MSEIPDGYIIVPTSAWQELVQYELRCQELAAVVEVLHEKLGKALDLAEVRAQAVQDFIQFMYSQDNCQLCNSSLDIASKYADSILKGEVK